jgi:hypothetical protein
MTRQIIKQIGKFTVIPPAAIHVAPTRSHDCTSSRVRGRTFVLLHTIFPPPTRANTHSLSCMHVFYNGTSSRARGRISVLLHKISPPLIARIPIPCHACTSSTMAHRPGRGGGLLCCYTRSPPPLIARISIPCHAGTSSSPTTNS